MFRAAVWPWRSATTQCSTRMRSPVCGSGQRAMSPAAKMPGALVCRCSSTTTPRSIARPAASASETFGRTPTPATARSASSVEPSLSVAVRPSSRATVAPRWNTTPLDSCRLRINRPSSAPITFTSGSRFGCDDMHLEPARAERGGDLEPDEARAHDECALVLSCVRARGNRPAVREPPEIVHGNRRRAGERQPHGFGARGEQQRVERVRRAALQPHLLARDVDRLHARVEPQVDLVVRVELGRPERNPVLLRRTGQIILGQVRPIDRRVIVGAEHRDGPVEPPRVAACPRRRAPPRRRRR